MTNDFWINELLDDLTIMDSQGRLGLLLLLMPLIIMIKSWNVKLGFTPAYSLCPLLKRVQKKQEQPWLGLAFLHVCMLSRFSRVQLSVTLWTVARQTPLSMGLCQQKLLEWAAMTSSRGSSRPKDRTWVSVFPALADGFFITSATWEVQYSWHRVYLQRPWTYCCPTPHH